MNSSPVKVVYYSDVLCIWAYCAQVRVDAMRAQFGEAVTLEYRFIPVFGSTAQKIGAGWEARGGFAGYARHVQETARRFSHVAVMPDLWAHTRPASSSAAHLFLKAVQRVEGAASPAGGMLERAAWALRLAFFRDGRDIATRSVQMELAESLGLPIAAIEASLADGRAMAALFEDVESQQRQKIEGSPTFLFNEGRQKLYGNVGYRVIEANIQELLHVASPVEASWC